MENTVRPVDHAPTTADRPVTGAEDRTESEGLIRDLYALAAFYAANPDHPRPDGIHLYHQVSDDAAVVEYANAHGAAVYGRDFRQTDRNLPGMATRVKLIVMAPPVTRYPE